MSRSWFRAGVLVAGCLASVVSRATADLVRLRNGGQVRGQVQSADEAVVVVRTLLGGTVSLDREEVELIERRSLLVEDYETRAQRTPDTVDAHWELAEWCKARGLKEQREEQLQLLLDIHPDHAEARRILGHIRHNGEWLTRDEWMTARGYVKHGGRYITPQERDLLLKSEAERAAETAWYPKIRLWFNWMTGRHPQRAQEGRANLAAVDDADAVPAIVNFLGEHADDNVRLLCVQMLGRLPGPKPVEPLVERSLFDGSHAVRSAARQAIKPEQYGYALEYYVPELRNGSNAIVQRAAAAIGEMGDITVVPYLIEALVTRHKWKVEVPAGATASFGMTPNGQVGLAGVPSGFLPAEVETLARTGQLPYGAIILPPRFQPRTTRIVTIKGDVKNEEVLAALKKLTGEDFGYNRRAWEVWWQTKAKS